MINKIIQRPVTISMLYIGLAILSIFAFASLGVDLLPNVNIPHLIVQTTYPNATAEEVEKQITEPLESAAGTVTGVKKVTSLSKEGISFISIDFIWGTDMRYALLSLREKLDNVSFALPKEAGRPTIIRVDPSSFPIMTLVLSYKNKSKSNISFVDHTSTYEEIKSLIDLKEAARVIFKRRFEQIEGVAQAVITGGLEREILIEVNPDLMISYNITFEEIENSLKSANLNLPAGNIMKGLFRYSLRTMGEFQNINEIKNTVISNNHGTKVLLQDIAKVTENFKERDGFTRFNSNEAIGVLIYKQPDANTVTISQLIKETVESLKRNYPDYDLLIVSDQSGFIEQAISNVKQEIFYGGILAVIVLFFFLGSIRNIFIIGVTIPASLIITILLLYLFNINFNIVSLGGIAVGIGMLLDNAIIVIENVSRYKDSGYNNKIAVLVGSKEVAMPIIASTLTTIAVFLPLIFVRGIAGELFKDQSYAIAFSLFSSIIVSLTLIPMLASRDSFKLTNKVFLNSNLFLKVNPPSEKSLFWKISFYLRLPFIIIFKSFFFLLVKLYLILEKLILKNINIFFKLADKFLEKTIVKYENLLEWSLNNRKKVLLITFGLILITVLAFINMKKEFIPKGENDEFMIEIEFPSGTSLKGNANLTSKIEKSISSIKSVNAIVSNIGRVNDFDFLDKEQVSVNKTNLIIKIDCYENYNDVRKILESILNKNNGFKYSFKEIKNSYSTIINPSENDIVIKIKNKNVDKALEKAELIIKKINNARLEGIKEVRLGIEKGTPEYSITIDREKCLTYGISVSQAAMEISNLVKGNVITYFSDFDKKIGINIKSTEETRNDIKNLMNQYCQFENKKIRIKDIANFQYGNSFNEIWREDQSRITMIYASLNETSLTKVINKIKNIINKLPKNQDEVILVGGVNEEINDAFKVLYVALIISVLLMYMVLASEFESFLFPFIILFSVPLGLIGGILLLFIFGESINIISIMGLIILVGIADNDAVVKVEFILRKREEGLSIHDAIVQAGKDRFRPIVMNTFTVIFGLIPMMIGIGAATQLRVSLSLAVIGGLVSSTFLTLIIIPVLYTYLEKFSKKKFVLGKKK
ncbi:MAG: efflux RND transporter permease subunit [Stygiobacter sp.]